MREELDNLTEKVLELGNKVIKITLKDFSGVIDAEELLQVDYFNIVPDIITFPVLFNRISMLKAEADSLEQTAKLNFEIFVAKLTEEKRKGFTRTLTDGKGKEKIQKPTIDEVDNAVKLSSSYRREKETLIEVQRTAKYVDALYWSAKSKQKMLEVMSAKIKPEDFEIDLLNDTINDVAIRSWDSAFQKPESLQRKNKGINPRLLNRNT